MAVRLAVCFAAILATGQCLPVAKADDPACRFMVVARVRSYYAPTPQTVGEIVLELTQPTDYPNRAAAQARAFEIAEHGYLHRTVPPVNAMSFYPTDALFTPPVIVRVTVVPWSPSGDPGLCFGL